VQVIIGEALDQERSEDHGGQPVVLLEANVDDVTGEILAHTVTALLAAGSHDAWLVPVIGKKGRPAHVVTAVVDPVRAGEIRRVLMSETGTLGVRSRPLTRWVAARRIEAVDVDGHPVRVKHSAGRVKAEFEDTARVGRLLDLPAREVARRAEEMAGRTISPTDANIR
jgi:uncharacterized protein (DUF111 family)